MGGLTCFRSLQGQVTVLSLETESRTKTKILEIGRDIRKHKTERNLEKGTYRDRKKQKDRLKKKKKKLFWEEVKLWCYRLSYSFKKVFNLVFCFVLSFWKWYDGDESRKMGNPENGWGRSHCVNRYVNPKRSSKVSPGPWRNIEGTMDETKFPFLSSVSRLIYGGSRGWGRLLHSKGYFTTRNHECFIRRFSFRVRNSCIKNGHVTSYSAWDLDSTTPRSL